MGCGSGVSPADALDVLEQRRVTILRGEQREPAEQERDLGINGSARPITPGSTGRPRARSSDSPITFVLILRRIRDLPPSTLRCENDGYLGAMTRTAAQSHKKPCERTTPAVRRNTKASTSSTAGANGRSRPFSRAFCRRPPRSDRARLSASRKSPLRSGGTPISRSACWRSWRSRDRPRRSRTSTSVEHLLLAMLDESGAVGRTPGKSVSPARSHGALRGVRGTSASPVRTPSRPTNRSRNSVVTSRRLRASARSVIGRDEEVRRVIRCSRHREQPADRRARRRQDGDRRRARPAHRARRRPKPQEQARDHPTWARSSPGPSTGVSSRSV